MRVGDFSVAQTYVELCGDLAEPIFSYWMWVLKNNAREREYVCVAAQTRWTVN